jgi:hypothetical protein
VADRDYLLMLMEYLTIYRCIWLAGRPRGGKTSLAIAMALYLVGNDFADKIAVNTPLTIGNLEGTLPLEEVQQLQNVATIIDEAWMQLGRSSKAMDRDRWLAYPGKLNQYLILPSARELHRDFADFVIERTMNWLPFGIPLWEYKYNLRGSKVIKGKNGRRGIPDVGRYLWWFPQRVFKYYHHKEQPKDFYYVYTF